MSERYQIDLQDLAATERQMVQQVSALCARLERVEDFDEEARAEMYSILQALKHESQFAAEQMESLLNQPGGRHV
jgi:hypothetical protein